MNWSSLKPMGYSVYMIGRIMGIVFLGFLLQVLLDNVLPTLHNFYESRYGGLYDGGFIYSPLSFYMFWIFPVAFYSFNLPKSKLFQGILFTTIVMPPLVWIDYQLPVGSDSPSETLHVFRHAFFSVPFMFMFHLFLPDAKLFHEP
ncbi:hypothetical protein [Salibacterium halotolerans]|uniref:Uncharacterized protein n=1 Tax=Salibacterium halotolerans TaxID=1884432 RepID=A0A1I5XXR1_9BACI|nr:hypothetical protein [Salibacterium halotolerans]SFQ36752.1 hypothetical protein SAMN05518683_1333 [Salibacterium halotolerans]